MDTYHFVIEAEPKSGNPVSAHASRAVAHFWVVAKDLDEAKDTTLRHLESEGWDVLEEKKASLLTPELIDELSADELANYKKAQSQGLHVVFYYYHRSD